MSVFNPEDFMVEPNQSSFNQLRKDDLISLGKHLKLEMRSAMRKREIQQIIIEHLVNQTRSFEPSVLEEYKITQYSNSVASSREVVDGGTEDNEKDRQRQREQDEIAWRREREKREWEREEREHQLKQQEIELQNQATKSSEGSTPRF